MKKIRMPGKLAHVLAFVLALLLTLTLTMTCLTWQVNRVLTDADMHRAVYLDSRVTDAQMARIQARVEEIAREHPFQVETVMDIVNEDAVKTFNSEANAWWMGLMQPDPVLEAPAFDASDVEAAVREDAVFLENTPSTHYRTVARDDIAYEVGVAVNKAVLPVRADVLSIVMPKVLEKIDLPVYMGYLAMTPWACLGVSAVLALLLVLVMIRRLSKAGLYIGAAMMASALCVAGLGVMLYLIGVTGMISELSMLLALQVSLLTKQIALQAGGYVAAALILGGGLIALHQADMNRLGKARRSIDA